MMTEQEFLAQDLEPEIKRGSRRQPGRRLRPGRRLGWGRPPSSHFPLSSNTAMAGMPTDEPASLGTEFGRWVQSSLNTILGTNLPVNGVMTLETRQAVRRFQQQQGLPADGIVGPDTQNVLLSKRSATRSEAYIDQHELEVPASADSHWQAVKERAIALAKAEYERWDRGHRHETNPKFALVLENYWVEGAGKSREEAKRIVRITQDSKIKDRPPWSAAFISWIMEKAGAGTVFKKSAGHYAYIAAAKRNRTQSRLDNPVWAYRISEVRPQAGDLVCNARCPQQTPSRCGATYDNIDNGNSWATHCDIVTEVTTQHIIVIGGNAGDQFGGLGASTVGKKIIQLDANGNIKRKGDPKNDYFAIIRIRTEAGPSSQPKPSSGPTGDLGSLPQHLFEAVRRGLLTLEVTWMILAGERDVNQLTNSLFFARHPERQGRNIMLNEPNFAQLSREWVAIRDTSCGQSFK